MQSNQTTEPGPVPYTLKIGVTGHRDLPDAPKVEDAVNRLLLRLKNSLESGINDIYQPGIHYNTKWQRVESLLNWRIMQSMSFLGIIQGHTEPDRRTALRCEVYSALARGADRIVARSVMKMESSALVAIIPGTVEEYVQDFTTPADRQEFNGLIEKASNHDVLKRGGLPASAIDVEKYEQAGKDIVDACEIMIAVWDGKPARGIGGTARIIKYACSVHRPVIWINAINPGASPVMITGFEEVAGENNADTTREIKVSAEPLPVFAAGWSTRFLQVAEYNRDKAFSKRRFEKQLQSDSNGLKQMGRTAGLPPGILDPLLEKVLPHYTRADYLATRYHKLHMRSAAWLYRLSAIAVTLAVIQTLFLPAYNVFVAFEIIALAIAVIWFRYSLIGQWHDKWLNYRHLAERTRILIFESLARRPKGAGARQNLNLPFYSSPGGWVTEVFSALQHEIPALDLPELLLPEVRCFINKGWIQDQAAYHEKNAVRKATEVKKENRVIGLLLAITLAAAIIHLSGLIRDPFFEHIIISLVIVLPAFAGAQHAIGSIRDYERIAARSARMKDILLNMVQRIEKASDWDEINMEIRNAEEIMSTENLEWSASLSFRRISLPV